MSFLITLSVVTDKLFPTIPRSQMPFIFEVRQSAPVGLSDPQDGRVTLYRYRIKCREYTRQLIVCHFFEVWGPLNDIFGNNDYNSNDHNFDSDGDNNHNTLQIEVQ
jgi:hypothetical protein